MLARVPAGMWRAQYLICHLRLNGGISKCAAFNYTQRCLPQKRDYLMSTPNSAPLAHDTMAYVLAGGRGSRLMELTDKRVKPAVFFGGKSRPSRRVGRYSD